MLDKRSEIREGINGLIGNVLIAIGCGEGSCQKAEIKALEAQETCLNAILSYLHSQGVVIKVEKELPEPSEICPMMQGRLLAYNIELRKAGCMFTDPLIKEV